MTRLSELGAAPLSAAEWNRGEGETRKRARGVFLSGKKALRGVFTAWIAARAFFACPDPAWRDEMAAGATRPAAQPQVPLAPEPPVGLSRIQPGAKEQAAGNATPDLGPFTIHGIVRFEERPCPGLPVTLSCGRQGGLQCSTVTDADGRYRFERLPKRRWFALLAESDECAAHALIMPETGDTEWDLTLEKNAFFRGRVLDSSGHGVVGAEVVPVVYARDAVLSSVTSDADGRFRVPFVNGFFLGAAEKSVFLWAAKDGLAGFSECTARVDGSGYGLIRIGPGRRISGRVVDEAGAPIRGAKLEISPQGVRALAKQTLSDDAGAFRVEGLAETSYVVAVTMEYPGDSGATARDTQTVSLLAGRDRDDVEFRLAMSVVPIGGRVTGFSGNPIRDASVRLVYFGNESGGVYTQETDASGHFAWRQVPAGDYELNVSREGYVSSRLKIPARLSARSMSIILMPAPIIDGIVRDARSGTPIEGADLNVAAEDAAYSDTAPGFTEVDTSTDATGVFRCAYGAFGAVTASVTAKGYAAQERILDIQPGENIEGLLFALEPLTTVSGIVLSAAGTPVMGARVCAIGTPASPGDTVCTDEQGRFTLDACVDGTCSLRVTWNAGEQEFPLSASDSPLVLVMAATGVLRGKVNAPDTSRMFVSIGSVEQEMTASVESGHFVLDEVPVGEYRLRLVSNLPDGGRATVSREVVVNAGDSNSIVIDVPQGTATIEGQCWLDGVHAGDSDLVLVYPDGGAVSPVAVRARSDDSGRYRIEGLPGGHAVLKASVRPGHGKGVTECNAFVELDVPEGGRANQDVWFRTKGMIAGEVAGLQPGEHTRVLLYPGITGTPEDGISRSLWLDSSYGTSESPRFRFAGVAPGTYLLVVRVTSNHESGEVEREMRATVTVSATEPSPCTVVIR